MKKGFMLFTLLAAFSGFAQADDAAIQQTLAKMGIKSSDIQPAPVAGMKTVLTNSGVLYITDDGKHIIQGPMYDVSGTAPVNVTNKMLLKQLNALEKEMIVYKALQEKHVITVFTDITCGYCHKLHEQMAQKRGALPYPVGAESKYEIPPLFYRLSGTFRQANPQSEHCAIRINPNRNGEETVLRILRESIASI